MKCPRAPRLAQPQGRSIWGSFRKRASFWATASSSPELAYRKRLLLGTKKCLRKCWLTHLYSFLTRRRNPLLKTCQSLEWGCFSQVQKSTVCGRRTWCQNRHHSRQWRGLSSEKTTGLPWPWKGAERLCPEFMTPTQPQCALGLVLLVSCASLLISLLSTDVSQYPHPTRTCFCLQLDRENGNPHAHRPHRPADISVFFSSELHVPLLAGQIPPSFQELYVMGFPSSLAFKPLPSSSALPFHFSLQP